MNPFQWAYNAIKGFSTPVWLKVMLGELQDVVFSILMQVGKNYLEAIKGKIIEVAASGELTGAQKFSKVVNYARKDLKLGEMKDSSLDLVIQYLVTKLKKDKTI